MSVISIILLTLGFAALLESLIVLIFTKFSMKICSKIGFKKIGKNKKLIKKLGRGELIISIILILIGINV